MKSSHKLTGQYQFTNSLDLSQINRLKQIWTAIPIWLMRLRNWSR